MFGPEIVRHWLKQNERQKRLFWRITHRLCHTQAHALNAFYMILLRENGKCMRLYPTLCCNVCTFKYIVCVMCAVYKHVSSTSPLCSIISSLICLNRDDKPTLTTITNKSMYVHMKVAMKFNILPINAFHGAYDVYANIGVN